MFRSSASISRLLVKRQFLKSSSRGIRLTQASLCQQLPPEVPKSGGKIFGKLLALLTVGTGGIIGYSWFDARFRKLLEDQVPYAKEVFNALFQNFPESKDVFIPKNSLPSLESSVTEFPKKADFKPAAVEQLPEKPKTKKELEAEKKKMEKEEVQRLLKEQEEFEVKQNIELESMLQSLLVGTAAIVGSAIGAAHSATEAVKSHTKKLKEALDTPEAKDGEWDAVLGAHDQRSEAIVTFESLSEKAKSDLEIIRSALAEGKKNKITKKNKVLSNVEGQINQLNQSFNSAVNEFSKAKSDAKVYSEYRDLVKKGKEQFKRELNAILPEVKKVTSSISKMTEDELNALITHAHRRIDQLQRQLAEQQALEKLRIEDALIRQKEEDEALFHVSLDQEKRIWDSRIELLKTEWDLNTHVNFEKELKLQLTRQAAAHSDHISDVLKVQQRELEAKFSVMLNEHIENERREFQKQVAGWVARLQGIEVAIDKHAELEKQGREIQKLWLACETLLTVLNTGNLGAKNWENRLKPLEAEVNLIRQAADGQPAIVAILEAVPEEALHRGVWTESALIERFKKVRKVCKQVAMIDETTSASGSLFKYALSYMQSKLIVPSSSKIYASSDVDVDPEDLKDVFVLLENAQACLDKGDFTQAVCFVNQLRGEPRRAASDWLTEARLLLESKQVAAALLASASAAGYTAVAGTT